MLRKLLLFVWTPSLQSWRAFNGDGLDTLAAIASLPPLRTERDCVAVAEALGYRADLSQSHLGTICALIPPPPAAIAAPRYESVTMGLGTPRAGPEDTREWASWYVNAPGAHLPPGHHGPLQQSRKEQHEEALKALPPLKYFQEIGKALRAQRKGRR